MNKTTTLHSLHLEAGAKMVPFAGYDMPVRYSSDKKEHLAVRNSVGIFDVSHMGEFIIRGPKALELVQKVSSNDASKLVPGKAHYSCMPNQQGGIVDDVIIYHIREDQYMIVVNASNIEKDWNWVSESNQSIGAELIDISQETSLIALSGPKAEATLQKLADHDLSTMGTYHCWKGTFNGAEKSLIATTGYTGERTFEVFVYNKYAEKTWNDILEAGKEFDLELCGLGARDTLRLEMGYMLYGNDINDETSPLEAGLGWITKLKKGPFNGSEAISKLKAEGLQKRMTGFKMKERGIPRAGYEIAKGGQVIGKVTSGSMSPVLNEGIGMGYLPMEHREAGTEIEILIRNKAVKAEVVKTPFIQK
ncbi:MAG: glycine cleavage system aminomethyltransferase GcvT [Bacteroidia bacterium]|nr:glycine cleavage system aminomethyltransferase GcvT [Bacteroidia bacterium]